MRDYVIIFDVLKKINDKVINLKENKRIITTIANYFYITMDIFVLQKSTFYDRNNKRNILIFVSLERREVIGSSNV